MQVRRAIVREPGASYSKCISSHPQRHTIDLGLARTQHSEYCRVLSEFGLDIIRLPRDDAHPDSCFVEDNAVVHRGKALICRMAKEARRGEEALVENALGDHLRTKKAEAPATIEGGDVIHLPDRLIAGVTQRTNESGVEQMAHWLDVKVDTITDEGIVHLKSYVNYLKEGSVISTARFASHRALAGLQKLVVPDEDWYSANNLVVNGTAITPKGFPGTERLLKASGLDVVALDMSEFPKCEGAMTCLSILF